MSRAVPTLEDCTAAIDRGDADDALKLAIERLRHDQHDLDALTVCFRAYTQKADRANAIKVLEVMTGIAPDSAWPFARLGRLLMETGDLVRAEESLRRAITIDPSDGSAHADLGILFSELNKLAAGEWHFRRALELSAPSTRTLTNLALNLAQQERGDEAAQLYEQALGIDPDDLMALAHYAKLKEVLGELDGAGQLLDRADRVRPGSVDLLRATLRARVSGPAEALSLLDGSQKINGDALLERARLRDRVGDFDGAWNDAVEAKTRLAREGGGLSYNTAGVEAFFGDLKEVFAAPFIDELPAAGIRSDTAQPIFITGAPRSGTTLLERMLASHSAVAAGGELPFIADLREFSEQLVPGQRFPHNLHGLRAGDRRWLATLFRDAYLARRAERMQLPDGVRFVTDKMPFNEVYLPLIRMAFPASPVIHLARNRLDTAVSILFNKLNHGFHCGYRMEDTLHHLDAVRSLVAHYRQQFEARLLEIEYEQLVSDGEAHIRRALEYIGLEFEPGCLTFWESRRYVATPSYGQVHRALSTESVDRHRNYLRHLSRFAG